MPHTKGRFSLPGDPKRERDRHKLAEFCHAYRQRDSTELLESWRNTVTPNLREKAVSALYSFAGLLTFLLGHV